MFPGKAVLPTSARPARQTLTAPPDRPQPATELSQIGVATPAQTWSAQPDRPQSPGPRPATVERATGPVAPSFVPRQQGFLPNPETALPPDVATAKTSLFQPNPEQMPDERPISADKMPAQGALPQRPFQPDHGRTNALSPGIPTLPDFTELGLQSVVAGPDRQRPLPMGSIGTIDALLAAPVFPLAAIALHSRIAPQDRPRNVGQRAAAPEPTARTATPLTAEPGARHLQRRGPSVNAPQAFDPPRTNDPAAPGQSSVTVMPNPLPGQPDLPATTASDASRATQPVQSHALPHHLPATLVKAASRAGTDDRVDLLLDPVELGRVRFELTSSADRVQVNVSVERPETLDLLRRHVDTLRAEFRDAGFDAASLSFSQWGKGGDPQPDAAVFAPDPSSDLPDDGITPQTPQSARNTSRHGLDLRL